MSDDLRRGEMVETPQGYWLRSWPSGHVHLIPDWLSDTQGRMTTACGKTLNYWPETCWPGARICPRCNAFTPDMTP